MAEGTLGDLRRKALARHDASDRRNGYASDLSDGAGGAIHVGDTLHLSCAQDEKLPMLARIAAMEGKVADLEVIPPSLKDIYGPFSAGGTANDRPDDTATALTEARIARRNHWVAIAFALMVVFAGAVAAGSTPTGALGADRLSVVVASLTSLSVYLVPQVALLMSLTRRMRGRARHSSLAGDLSGRAAGGVGGEVLVRIW